MGAQWRVVQYFLQGYSSPGLTPPAAATHPHPLHRRGKTLSLARTSPPPETELCCHDR